ncbi:hypothetical protein CC78DRAFT_282642 [Lojkania enalia]|uniref:Uncharacterized protein n=1 Tax=Lojkania enalia TaxID=147567 RepID=A0A9P4NAM3_9PLEO|nr:hypothetical protein CC78DRAFT_282642 [Didymosphaeria enalia]
MYLGTPHVRQVSRRSTPPITLVPLALNYPCHGAQPPFPPPSCEITFIAANTLPSKFFMTSSSPRARRE